MRYHLSLVIVTSILLTVTGNGFASKPSTTLYPRLTGPSETAATAGKVQAEDGDAEEEKLGQLFSKGYDRFEHGKYQQACQLFYQYLSI